MMIAFSIGSGQNPLQFLRKTSSATPAPTVASGAQPSAEVLGAVTAYDPRDGDSQRRQDIAAYAAAYMPLQKKGLYPVKPPAIKLALTDPATHQPYRVSVNPPAAPGDLQYWVGGSCDGPAQKPARSGSKTLALRLYLETSSTPACIQVR